jgi:hypothetical protein
MTLWDSSKKLKIELANTTRQHWRPVPFEARWPELSSAGRMNF